MSVTPGSQRALREANRTRLVSAVRRAGTPTQAEISRLTGLSPATVSNIVRDLSGTGLLRTSSTVSGGRRATAVSLGRSAGVAVGLDFGRRHLRVAVCDLAHEVLAERVAPLEPGSPAAQAIRLAVSTTDELLAELGVERGDVVGVGAGVPGPVDNRTGTVVEGTILPEWVGLRAAAVLTEALGTLVLVDNDANLGVLAETVWGAAQGVQNAAYIKISTGVGAGLVVGGELYRGETGTAGEIGHTTIDEDGPVCRCGNRGCLETKASVPVMCDLLERSLGSRPSAAEVVRRAAEGDSGCRRVIEDVGRYVGMAVANLANLLNPSVVVIGGDLAPAGDVLLEPMRSVVRRHAVPVTASVVTVCGSQLGDRAQVLGALALVLRSDAVPSSYPRDRMTAGTS